MASEKVPKSSKIYECKNCNYSTSRKSQYERHLSTDKHKKYQNASKMELNASKKVPKDTFFSCECGKSYRHDSSYYKHKKKCKVLNETLTNDKSIENIDNKELVLSILKQNTELIKENSEFKQMMMETQSQMLELIKKGTNNNTNCHNKTFNLNFFLNETCKNAMNIMDFVDSLQLQLNDLEKMGDVGYINGMSNIIIKNLKELDVTQRPLHCTDTKRETLYIKDENKWDKEKETKPKIRKVIKYIAHKNSRLLKDYKKNHPDCIKSESKYSDTYNKIMIESMGGKGENNEEKEDKIITNISKEVILNK
jgi:hypothetical protein